MDISIQAWQKGFSSGALEGLAELWNANAVGRHAFYPWSGELLHGMWSGYASSAAMRIYSATSGGKLVGFVHVALVDEPGYSRSGAVEALLVAKDFRRCGVGSALMAAGLSFLDGLRVATIDAMGAWPYGPLYSCLADGAERSGVFTNETDILRLFGRFDFKPVRMSEVMRLELDSRSGASKADWRFNTGRRSAATWLDYVFRRRELWDHVMLGSRGTVLSRAIYGRMDGESDWSGREIYGIFGVSTPEWLRGRGYAGENLRTMLNRLAGIGAEMAELHVYTDNLPAMALYRSLGFSPVAATAMMRRDQ